MPEVKQPQDRRPKSKAFSFEDSDGKSHALPLASIGAANVPGRITRDAIMSADDTAEMRLAFALLEACGAPDPAVEALYSLPTDKMIKVLGDWMTHGDGDGATVPQS